MHHKFVLLLGRSSFLSVGRQFASEYLAVDTSLVSPWKEMKALLSAQVVFMKYLPYIKGKK